MTSVVAWDVDGGENFISESENGDSGLGMKDAA